MHLLRYPREPICFNIVLEKNEKKIEKLSTNQNALFQNVEFGANMKSQMRAYDSLVSKLSSNKN